MVKRYKEAASRPRTAGKQCMPVWSKNSSDMTGRDLGLFLRSLQREEGTDERLAPRLARTFQHRLRQTLTPAGHRAWSDKTIQRILAPLKTFAPWVHTH